MVKYECMQHLCNIVKRSTDAHHDFTVRQCQTAQANSQRLRPRPDALRKVTRPNSQTRHDAPRPATGENETSKHRSITASLPGMVAEYADTFTSTGTGEPESDCSQHQHAQEGQRTPEEERRMISRYAPKVETCGHETASNNPKLSEGILRGV